MNSELVNYIENEIFPLYNRNEEGHGINHIKAVIKRSLELAQNYDVDIDMVYTIAAYHDLGHYIDRKTKIWRKWICKNIFRRQGI